MKLRTPSRVFWDPDELSLRTPRQCLLELYPWAENYPHRLQIKTDPYTQNTEAWLEISATDLEATWLILQGLAVVSQ